MFGEIAPKGIFGSFPAAGTTAAGLRRHGLKGTSPTLFRSGDSEYLLVCIGLRWESVENTPQRQ